MNLESKSSRSGFKAISTAWSRLREHAEIGVIRNDKDYQRMSALLDRIIDEIGSDEEHPLATLAELLGDLIERYEERNVRIPAASPVQVLQVLMDQNSLRQSDL